MNSRSDRGQATVLTLVFLVVLLGMAALVLDIGSWYRADRATQSTADAAALAGAQALPSSPTNANTLSLQYVTKNGGGSPSVTFSTKYLTNDTVKVNVKVIEGTRERVQAYEGVCIGRKNAGLNSHFTVRKISYGEGVERVFPLYSPRIDSIEVVRRGAVRRAKLYYLRDRRGKAARITERRDNKPQEQGKEKA